MQAEHRRKRKRFLKSPSSSLCYCLRFFALLFFLTLLLNGGFPLASDLFRPVLVVFRSSPLLSRVSNITNKVYTSKSDSQSDSAPLIVEDRIVFPDHVLLLFSKNTDPYSLHTNLPCIYRSQLSNSSYQFRKLVTIPILSTDDYDELRSIARCPLPPANYSNAVTLRRPNGSVLVDKRVHSWEMVAYAAALDGETAVVFVKGLNLRPDRVSDPSQVSCHFNWGNSNGSRKYGLTTDAVTAAQEVVRCSLPITLQKHPALVHGVRVSISVASQPARRGGRGRSRAAILHPPIPSVAKLLYSDFEDKGENKYELCACTMLWNQASALREWIIYHSWLGVERWFIYDNNSDDTIKEVIAELQQENYNVSRQVWPWIKTQEAGFSHCTLKAKKECAWVAFMDVDEFFYFPLPTAHHRKTHELEYPGQYSLRSLVANYSSTSIGEIRTTCHSFGPSGLSSRPSKGVTVGYTCRLQSPERHKSIVRLDALDNTLLNVVHHFHLKKPYRYLNLPQSTATINHYKYQVWQVFRAKFFRRVATYVADWQESQNEGSKDRAPGLGTEAIEPPNWRLQFCEVWDTGLRDVVIANLANPASGLLPWEKPRL